MECDHARNVAKREVLAFLLDSKYNDWPLDQKDNYRLVRERDTKGILKEVKRNEKNLKKFKKELGQYFRSSFTDAASVRHLVSEALSAWRQRNPQVPPATERHDPETYLKLLEDNTRQIRIKALKTKRAEPYVFNIDEIYISLSTISGGHLALADPSRKTPRDKDMEPVPQRGIALEKALSERKIVIVGDPGSGKSTFLRRVAFELCRNLRGTRPSGAAPFLPAGDMRFPILIRIADLAKLLAMDITSKPPEAPDWLPYFLGKQSDAYKWGAGETFFQVKLAAGGCLIMIDGLDEAPKRRMRERIARLFENATRAFPKCDFLVSTRPSTNTGDSVLADFRQLQIGELELPEIEAFFHHFAKGLALPDAEAKTFRKELHLALTSRVEIREMAANPVMLTALAVLQHNDQRLPEYRVDLFGSILSWLAAARDSTERPRAEQSLKQMRKLALHMQDFPGGRLVQINKRSAAEFLTQEFGGDVDANEEMLERETNESGIISSIGTDLKFWHLSFQEYLAALEIGGLSEAQQLGKVVSSGRLYEPEWRETMRLLGGELFKQGEAKVEGLFQAILSKLGPQAAFESQVRCAALLSAMMLDLSRMKYVPKTPDYQRTVKAVMGIFEKGEAKKIEIEKRIEAAELLAQVGDPRLDDENWIAIPGGTFRMGAQKKDVTGANYDPEAYDEESPVHEVTLRGFRIRRFLVTVQEFEKFIKSKGYSTPKYWTENYGKFNQPENWDRQKQHATWPVVGVSWFEAAAYCAWANSRLPTEAEWERAARGPHSLQHPWGDEPPLDPSYANYSGIQHPTPVGLFPKGNTAEEVCDMLGNVYEWCSDWFGSYGEGILDNPTGPASGDRKLLRGGCWGGVPRYVRVSYRYWFEPALRYNIMGFRCAGELR